MVRLIPDHACDNLGYMPLAVGLFVSVSALVALCAKHARRVPQKHKTETNHSRFAPKSPLPSPRKLVTTMISNKEIPFSYKKKGTGDETGAEIMDRGFGEGGLWQKEILMGEKCRPPEFSGVIYYDGHGNQLSELPPRSPRASPLPSFLIPAAKEAN